MGFRNFIKYAGEVGRAVRIGQNKAKRDIELCKMFFDEHGNNPPYEIAERFFSSLGDDVDRDSEYEEKAYLKDIRKFQDKWRKSNPEFRLPGGVTVGRIAIQLPDGMSMDDVDNTVEGREFLANAISNLISEKTGVPVEEVRAAFVRRGLQANLEAGKCLGCGGDIDEDGDCVGDQGLTPTPTQPEVSETEQLEQYVSTLSSTDKLRRLVYLRSRLDQLKAESEEIDGVTPGMADELNSIVAELAALNKSTGSL